MQYEALAYLAGGFGIFGLVGLAAAYNDKASKRPWVRPLLRLSAPCILVGCLTRFCSYRKDFGASAQVPKQYPYDNLSAELGGECVMPPIRSAEAEEE